MPTVTKYCNTYSQTADSNNAKFNNLVTLKSASGYAETNTISKKGGTHPKPSTVTATNFQFNLPTGAEVTKIKVEYAHRKLATTKDKYPSIPAPTIDLVGASAKAKTGVAPLGVTKTNTITWTGNWTRSTINSANFGVKIAYKSNTSKDYTGKVRLSLLRITVEYKLPNFAIALSVNGDKTVEKEGTVNITLSNLNKTSYSPNVDITLPPQVTYLGSLNTITKNSNTSLTWKPNIKSNTSNAGVSLKIRFDEATVDSTVSVTVRETYSGKSKTATFSINPKVITGDETSDDESITEDATVSQSTIRSLKSYYITDETSIIYTFYIPENNPQTVWRTLGAVDVFNTDEIERLGEQGIEVRALYPDDGDYIIRVPENLGNTIPEFQLTMDFSNLDMFDILIREWLGGQDYAELTRLYDCETNLCLMRLTQEELDRLGDGYTYTVQAYAKATLNTPSSTYKLREGKHYLRLGVFNGDASNFEHLEYEMVKNCENWSNAIESLDQYYDLKTEFVYNKDYPVYVFMTGEYLELNDFKVDLDFTQPVIIESDYYDQKGRVTQNILPYPIMNATGDGETSSMTVNTFQESNPIILYDFELPDNFSTDDEVAIRGIKLTADIIADDECIINAKLKLDGGKTGERSLVLAPLDTMSEEGQITLGGSTDLWGFSVGDMQNLDQAEIELSFNNLFTNENNQVQLQISNITVTVYYLNITLINEIEKCLINDEDIAWYGVYLKSLADLHGLKTDTNYITVKGTDTNEPYVQTIQEKEIEIDFGIDADTVKESSELMKSFVRHITNERDKYNKPILNKIEFPDLYPDEHWDFILDGGVSHSVSFKEQEGTLKLIIPSGTSYANEDTYANTRGYNNGIANVNPIITAIPLAETVEITETVHNQNWKIQYPFPENSLLEINCNDRTATLKIITDENNAGTDITEYADYNNDWFLLYLGEFNFESQTSIIRTVQYNERG